jgi:hypothetical protein
MQYINEQFRSEQAARSYLAANPLDTETTEKLEALGASTSPETVAEVLGNELYTWVICSICQYRVDDAVRITGNVDVCEDCLAEATRLLKSKATCH